MSERVGMVSDLSPLLGAGVLLAYPAYILLMAGVMRICGVPKAEIAKWVLRQAERQRLTDLIRAARGLPEPPSSPGPAPRPAPPGAVLGAPEEAAEPVDHDATVAPSSCSVAAVSPPMEGFWRGYDLV
jgi:hypothetical protein